MLVDLAFKDPALYAAIVLVVLASIVLHELGHVFAATWEGDPTPRMLGHLTWNPRVHMGWMSIGSVLLLGIGWGATPVNPRHFRHRRWGQVLVSFAGPAVNLALAVAAAALAVLSVRTLHHVGPASPGASFVWAFGTSALQFNMLLFLFNMIPVPPLDGLSVAEGIFDLGHLPAWLRRVHPFPLLVVWFALGSGASPLYQGVESISLGLIRFFGTLFA